MANRCGAHDGVTMIHHVKRILKKDSCCSEHDAPHKHPKIHHDCAMFTMLLEFQYQKFFSKTHCCCCITGLCTSHKQGEIELDINWKLFRVLDMLKWFVVFLSCDFLRSPASLIYFTVHRSPNLAKPNASMMDET